MCTMLLWIPIYLLMTLFDFQEDTDTSTWYVVNDGVMGGISEGQLRRDDSGYGVFEGRVSLENNGGFASVRCRFAQPHAVGGASSIRVRLKGDGKTYQLRLRQREDQSYAYIFSFPTSGEWETVTVPLFEMYPSFRGRRLDRPNFAHEQIAELAFLIADKQSGAFQLLLDNAVLR